LPFLVFPVVLTVTVMLFTTQCPLLYTASGSESQDGKPRALKLMTDPVRAAGADTARKCVRYRPVSFLTRHREHSSQLLLHADGITYQRQNIERYIENQLFMSTHAAQSPVTRLPLASTELTPDHAMKSRILRTLQVRARAVCVPGLKLGATQSPFKLG
jgi:hypothetical protein